MYIVIYSFMRPQCALDESLHSVLSKCVLNVRPKCRGLDLRLSAVSSMFVFNVNSIVITSICVLSVCPQCSTCNVHPNIGP